MEFNFETKVASAVAVGAITLCVIQAAYFIKSIFFHPLKTVANVQVQCLHADGYKKPVTVYVLNGAGVGISISQYSTKLSTFLRLTGVPHIVKAAQFENAPKGKTPYIEHDGSVLGDSQLIIRYLENSFDLVKMSVNVAKKNGSKAFVPFSALSPQDQAISDIIRLATEGDIYWANANLRWAGEYGIGKSESHWVKVRTLFFNEIPAFIRGAITNMIRVSFLRDAWGQGLVRHSPDDQLYLAQRALKSLSTVLGQKQFFLGDAPSECDCAAFGCLEAVLEDALWPSPLSQYTRAECPNLVAYVSRVRELAFADVSPADLRPHSQEAGTAFPRK